ncbi:MAG TPA: Rrf2 family transcriptional regulator [Candidatus Limivivens merdigallinarum]|uniref:Rrf2 family transcriptional regulator n=1 Tax=Candidatus Limivivens merdigallinarum TaxID=2840859 RepID=A0A9D1D146_9FIRM|nr:Rrf2 family transcriptional regulator [Candidatus Limivivens merdigallinarum]
MKISTKGRYALRLMLDLAEHQGDGYVALKDVADRQEISKKYLEQIVPMLTTAGLLKTTRGASGGYRLKNPCEEYNVYQILKVTEGGMSPVACLEDERNQCGRSAMCQTLEIWVGLEKVIREYLEGITLQSILEKSKGKKHYQI